MTTYQKISMIIAALALLQPWLIKLFQRFFKKIRINFIPSSKIKLYYNRSGAYIYLGGVIESKNNAAIVKDISVKAVRESDKAELCLDWSSFMVPVFQSVAGNPITTSEIARPFKVELNSLYPVFVEFASTNIQELDRLNEIYNTVTLDTSEIAKGSTSYEQAKDKYISSKDYNNFRDELLQSFYWKADNYIIILGIAYNDKKFYQCKFKFSIDTKESSIFKENIEKLLLFPLNELYREPTGMLYYPQKDFISFDCV